MIEIDKIRKRVYGTVSHFAKCSSLMSTFLKVMSFSNGCSCCVKGICRKATWGQTVKPVHVFAFVYDNGSLKMLPATVKISVSISVVFSEAS